jgi:LL-diaminopimelate aminotransferase
VVEALTYIGLTVNSPKASLYVWASVPDGYTSAEFAGMLLEEKDIVVTPGSGYGRYGEGYIRLSLTLPDEDLEEGISRLSGWSIPPATVER